MYGEVTVGYKLVDSRILTPQELKKMHRKKSNRIKYADGGFATKVLHCKKGGRFDAEFDKDGYNLKGFNPETGLHKNGTYFDDDGYNINGYNRKGYDKNGHSYGRDHIEEEKKQKDKLDEIKRLLG